MDPARRTVDLLEERPDLEPAVGAVLEPDPPFGFDDVAVDSGAFGELVSRGVVKKTDGGYRVPDPDAVRRVLAGERPDETGLASLGHLQDSLSVPRLELASLLGALLLVAAFRLLPLPTVFRNGAVVLSSNDPYFYRYWVDGLLAAPDVNLATLPGSVTKGEPLFVMALWLASGLFGGTTAVAGHVMAWYPVVTALLSAVLIYAVTVVVTDDRRVGLAAVAMLAVLPAHAFRTSLGFADHHAFDYLWLALTVLGLVVPARGAVREDTPRSWTTTAAAGAIGVGVAGQTLAWDNSPILLVPLGLYLALDALRAVNRGKSPLPSGGPVLVGTAIGAALVWAAHATLGWHTALVASAPALLVIGGLGVLALGELVHRFEQPVAVLGAGEAFGGLAGVAALSTLFPEYWTRLTTSVSARLLAPRPIAEVEGLFGDSGGWLLLYGFVLFLALPYLVWGTYRAVDDGRWLPLTAYAWYFLVLAVVQVRFVGEHALVLVPFAGLGLVHLAERVDLARRPAPFVDGRVKEFAIPEPRAAGQLALLFLLVASLSIVQVPVKTSQVTTPPELYGTASFLADYSDERDLAYPRNYVLSAWSWNRVYNYYVSGESKSYGYARQHFGSFVRSSDPGGWYERLSGRGFVVTTPDAVGEPGQLGTRLHAHNGARAASTPGLAHYQLVYVAEGGEYKAFAIVPGAVIRGTAAPNATVTAATDVAVPGARFTYRRQATTGPNGTFTVRVAHPGTYRVAGSTVTVRESHVVESATVRVDEAGG